MRKMRWMPILIYSGNSVNSSFAYAEVDGTQAKYWAAITYDVSTDKYYGVIYNDSRDTLLTTEPPFDTLEDALMEIEQRLFERGIRDEA